MAKAKNIELKPMDIHSLSITLVGDSPLISHAWSEKAKKEMLDKQMQVDSVTGAELPKIRAPKDPHTEYLGSLYNYPGGGYGFPAVAFKSAAVDACAQFTGLTKVDARAAFHINCDLVKIEGKPTLREDMVKIGGISKVADLRYRGEFKEWQTTFPISYNQSVISADQLVNLFKTAGFGVGVGEWRPQKDGSFGRFHVKSERVAKA